MYQNKILTTALASLIASSAFSNSLAPAKYEFIEAVEAACSTGIENCPDNAGIEILVSNIDAAENTLETEQSELAIQNAIVSAAQASYAANSSQGNLAALNNALAVEQEKQGDVNTAQAALDALNVRATALKESSTLEAVFAYYDSKSLIADQILVVAQAAQDEQAARDAIPALEQALDDAEFANEVAAQNLEDAQAILTEVTAEELGKPEPDTAAIEAATQGVVQAQLLVAQTTVDVGVAENELQLGQTALSVSEASTVSENEILQTYQDSTVSLGEAAATQVSSISGYLDADAVYKNLLSNEQEQVAQTAESAAALALQNSQAAEAALVVAEDALVQAESERNAARAALQEVNTSDLEALLAAANALSEANANVVAANNDLGLAAQDVADTAAELIDADQIAANERADADQALNEARSAQATSLSEDEFIASGSPAVALKNSFVSGTDEGQAIIDAVHANYGHTVTNAENIDSNTADIAANGDAITANGDAITANGDAITANGDAITANAANITTNAADIATNVTSISANAADITTNAADIATNVTSISANTADITTNAADIATNATSISANTADITTNAADIATNVTSISANAADITTNAADIATNATSISANAADITTNAADIATNVTSISANAADITTNAADIATNATSISANTADIASNSSSISVNAAAIGTNAVDIANNSSSITDLERSMAVNVDMLKSGIASSLAIAGLPTLTSEGFAVSVGLGYFEGENAAAMGFSHVSDSRVFKLSVGHSNGNTSGSLGAAFRF
jgi:hypothetical protein